MYVWTTGTPKLDGDLEAGIVCHLPANVNTDCTWLTALTILGHPRVRSRNLDPPDRWTRQFWVPRLGRVRRHGRRLRRFLRYNDSHAECRCRRLWNGRLGEPSPGRNQEVPLLDQHDCQVSRKLATCHYVLLIVCLVYSPETYKTLDAPGYFGVHGEQESIE